MNYSFENFSAARSARQLKLTKQAIKRWAEFETFFRFFVSRPTGVGST